MKKKLFIFTAVLAILCSSVFTAIAVNTAGAENQPVIWDGKAASSFAGGDGTQDRPYQISDGKELALLRSVINDGAEDTGNGGNFNAGGKHYKLTADIYLNDTDDYENWGAAAPGNMWAPIGLFEPTHKFAANFDGGGHVIHGLFIDSDTADYQGLFGYVSGGAIQNTDLEKSCVNGRSYVGGIAGFLDKGSISGCYNKGAVKAGDNGGYSYAGGVIGAAHGIGCTVTDCCNTGDVSGTGHHVGGVVGAIGAVAGGSGAASGMSGCRNKGATVKSTGGQYVGGVSGYVGEDCFVVNCFNTAAVSSVQTNVGGVAGRSGGGNIINCYNTGAVSAGTVSGSSYSGGIIGSISTAGGSITNCYNTGAVSGQAMSTGGLIGSISAAGSIKNSYFLKVNGGVNSSRNASGNSLGATENVLTFGVNGVFAGGAVIEINDLTYSVLAGALNAWVYENRTETTDYSCWAGEPYPVFGHSYTAEITNGNSLHSAATCTEAATYWCSCPGCGGISDALYFEAGEPLGHDFTDKIISADTLRSAATETEAATYWYSCPGCGEISDALYFTDGEPLGSGGNNDNNSGDNDNGKKDNSGDNDNGKSGGDTGGGKKGGCKKGAAGGLSALVMCGAAFWFIAGKKKA